MAEPSSGLPDISKANFYGQGADAQQELIDANESALKALQQRYENPNWFNVAAGFFKPQLGGFAASLGSASQALGENLEKQRANELPVAQQRAQLALMKNQLGQTQKANELLAAAKGVVTPDLVREMEARVGKDHPAVVAARGQLEIQQKEQTLAQGAQGLTLQQIQTGLKTGAISMDEAQAMLAKLPGMGAAPNAPPAAAAVAGAPPAAAAAATPPAPAVEGAPASEKKEPVVITSPLGSQARIPEDIRAAQAAARETAAAKRFESLGASGGTDESYRPMVRILGDQTSLIQKNPDIAKQVMSVMAQGTFRSQIEALLQAGVGLNFQGLAGNIHIPVSVAKKAGWNDQQREVADALATNFAALAVAKQRAGGVSPNSARNMELGLYNDLTPSMETTPNAALKAMGHFRNDLDATRAQYNFANDVYYGRNANVKLGQNIPNPMDAILNHPSFNDVYTPFAEKNKQLSEAYQAHITKAKKP
jgi:hypothetical protein